MKLAKSRRYLITFCTYGRYIGIAGRLRLPPRCQHRSFASRRHRRLDNKGPSTIWKLFKSDAVVTTVPSAGVESKGGAT